MISAVSVRSVEAADQLRVDVVIDNPVPSISVHTVSSVTASAVPKKFSAASPAEAVVNVSALPVKAPVNPVDEIDVAPVTTPASIIIVPSNTICCPPKGVIVKSVPAVEEISLPL